MVGSWLACVAAPNRNLPPPVAVCELGDDRVRQVMTFREISAKHWRRPALVFNGGEEDTFEINSAQLITLTLTLHPDALRAEVRDSSGILPVHRSARREDDCGRGLAIIIDALAEYWTPGRAPRGGKRVRPCTSGGNGLFDGGR